MNSLPVSPERARYEDDGMWLRVLLPPKRSGLVIGFLVMWLAVWIIGGREAMGNLTSQGPNTDRVFSLVWVTIWILGAVSVVSTFLWMVFGREIIQLGPDQLILQRRLLGIPWSRAYDVANVKDLRAGPVVPSPFHGGAFQRLFGEKETRRPDMTRLLEMWGLGGGPITFDYGPKTIRCGACLDEAEGKMVIERLRRRNSRLRAADPPADYRQ